MLKMSNVQHNKGAGVIVQKGISEAERELYERIISRLEKDLIEQQNLIEEYKSELKALKNTVKPL